MRCESYGNRLKTHFEEGSKILSLWNMSSKIREAYGRAAMEVGAEGSKTFGLKMLEQLVRQRTG